MAIRTRPIRDVIVERQIADEAAAFDLANAIGEAVEEGQSELMTKADGRTLLSEMREMFAKLDARITESDAKSVARDAEADAKNAERQAQTYRFILLVGAATTTIISIVVAFT